MGSRLPMALSERRAKLLALIVEDYVDSAQPVGSVALVARHDLDLSSATVRSEMAALEEEGLVTHPHTSAGRVPSNLGYRTYVGSLMGERRLSSEEELTILHQFHQSAVNLERWVALSASVLANALHTAAIATTPHLVEVRLKQLQLVALTEERALLITVMNDAAVRQSTLEFGAAVTQEQLTRLAGRLNESLAGRTATEIAARMPGEGPDAASETAASEILVRDQVVELLRNEADATSETPVVEGVRELLRQPEYEGDSDRLLDTLEAVERSRLQRAIPARSLANGGVAIVIGDENPAEPYREMSFVLTRYGPPSGAGGLIGLLGPTRLDYPDAVAHVRYVSDVLTELMRRFYGDTSPTGVLSAEER